MSNCDRIPLGSDGDMYTLQSGARCCPALTDRSGSEYCDSAGMALSDSSMISPAPHLISFGGEADVRSPPSLPPSSSSIMLSNCKAAMAFSWQEGHCYRVNQTT